ncbi:MAG: glycosyltransferase [Akkermansiaceae bacterium]|nr:glycosyltransferase [Akkermansiaceae bacterium]
MRILFTNNTFDRPAGTELSAFDAIRRLKALGHEAAAFSRQLGEVAERLRALGAPVVDDLDDLPEGWTPEIVHGQHFWETSLAALRFPGTPVLSFCRGATPWQEAPCRAPNVAGHVAVDEDCRDRLVEEEGVAPDSITVVLNGVDADRFPPRPPLPEKPARALVFSNYAKPDNYFATIRAACAGEDIDCEALGVGMGNAVADPAPLLAGSDLVFAKGKAALEALVTGCGVIVCDEPGIGHLVTGANFESLRRRSFGYSCMPDPVTAENVRRVVGEWRREACREAAETARRTATLEATVAALLAVYESTVDAWNRRADRPGPEAFHRWATGFFTENTHAFKLGREMQQIWREGMRLEPPIGAAEATAEMNRILHSFRQVEERIAKYESRLQQRDAKILNLKQKLRSRESGGHGDGDDGEKRGRFRFWRRS